MPTSSCATRHTVKQIISEVGKQLEQDCQFDEPGTLLEALHDHDAGRGAHRQRHRPDPLRYRRHASTACTIRLRHAQQFAKPRPTQGSRMCWARCWPTRAIATCSSPTSCHTGQVCRHLSLPSSSTRREQATYGYRLASWTAGSWLACDRSTTGCSSMATNPAKQVIRELESQGYTVMIRRAAIGTGVTGFAALQDRLRMLRHTPLAPPSHTPSSPSSNFG